MIKNSEYLSPNHRKLRVGELIKQNLGQIFLKNEAKINTMAVGLIVHADQAEEILQKQKADLIAIAREAMHNPNWPIDAAQKLGVSSSYSLMPSPYEYWLEKRSKQVQNLVPSTHSKGIEI